MLEDEALGFCYALQRYSSQDENRYPSPMFPTLLSHENKQKNSPNFAE